MAESPIQPTRLISDESTEPARSECRICGRIFGSQADPWRSDQGTVDHLDFGYDRPYIHTGIRSDRLLASDVCNRCCTECDNCGRVLPTHLTFQARLLDEQESSNLRYRSAQCSMCTRHCDSCGEAGDLNDVVTVSSPTGMQIRIGYECCYAECDDCGRGMVERGRLGGSCFHCGETTPSHRIRSYGYKPAPTFFGANNNSYPQLFIGIEQELEAKGHSESNLNRAVDMLDERDPDHVLYSKQDGSLECGIEIVSHPMSLDFFKDEYPWELWKHGDGLGKFLKQEATTGVHIHISKAAFSKAHAYRFTAFHFLNPSFIENVAGRLSNHYTQMRPYGDNMSATRPDLGGRDRYGMPTQRGRSLLSHLNQQAKLKTYNYDRYWGINAQNHDTYELRYFRSTTDANRLRFYGEWMEACFLYTNTGWIRTNNEERRLTPVNFSKWVQTQQSGRWPRIERFLVREALA